MVGSHLIRCNQCGGSFTATAWLLHAHNPNQAYCEIRTCRRKAVGLCEVCAPLTTSGWRSIAGGLKLCGEHLLEHRRRGDTVRIVDGSVCRVCDGRGEVQSQGVDLETPGGRWARCPHCQGNGYDPDLRSRAPRRSPFAAPPLSRPAPEPSPPKPPLDWDAVVREYEEQQAAPTATPVDWDALARAYAEQQATAEVEKAAVQKARAEAQRVEKAEAAERARAEKAAAEKAFNERTRANLEIFRRRAQRRRRRKKAMSFLVQATVATLAGAAVGVLLVFPLLPADVADQVIELQQRVSEMFG